MLDLLAGVAIDIEFRGRRAARLALLRILPEEAPAWERIEQAARTLFDRYGYREIRPPVIEETQLFARSIGAETDIVAKEMYTFEDRDGSSITLRPEATPSGDASVPIWAARRNADLLAEAVDREIEIAAG